MGTVGNIPAWAWLVESHLQELAERRRRLQVDRRSPAFLCSRSKRRLQRGWESPFPKRSWDWPSQHALLPGTTRWWLSLPWSWRWVARPCQPTSSLIGREAKTSQTGDLTFMLMLVLCCCKWLTNTIENRLAASTRLGYKEENVFYCDLLLRLRHICVFSPPQELLTMSPFLSCLERKHIFLSIFFVYNPKLSSITQTYYRHSQDF